MLDSLGRAGHMAFRGRLVLAVPLLVVGVLFLLATREYATRGGTGDLSDALFPMKIWQSWKVDALRFEERDIVRARSWTTKNPEHRYEVLTDFNSDRFVEEHYGRRGFNRPDVVDGFRKLKAIRIVQADLLRYLIMYAVGGVYADIDAEALAPVSEFIPHRFDLNQIGMVIGVETDEPTFTSHPILGAKAVSFCQWTFMSKPRMPVLLRLIESILAWAEEAPRQQNCTLAEVKLDFNEVLSISGPSAFTREMLAEMSRTEAQEITWDTFHDLRDSRLIGNTLVLTSEAFAAGTGHSHSGNHEGQGALVHHHFHASTWTSSYPRFRHPVYGQVEDCNWQPDCVKLWDANIAAFGELPEDARSRIIATKLEEDKDANTPTDPGAGKQKGNRDIGNGS